MDLGFLVALTVGAILLFVPLIGIYAGIRRMQGHQTRFDRFFELYARTQGAAVYPPCCAAIPTRRSRKSPR
ncbi:MAG: hypothetical protein ABI744_05630 [Chloroflexota bacterium]